MNRTMQVLAVVATVALVAIAGMMAHGGRRAYQAREAAETAANKRWYREGCENARAARTSIYPSEEEKFYCEVYPDKRQSPFVWDSDAK